MIESEKRVVGEDSPDLARHVQQPRHPPPPSSSASTTERDERKGSFKSKLTSKLSGFLSRAKEEPVKEESPDLVLGKVVRVAFCFVKFPNKGTAGVVVCVS